MGHCFSHLTKADRYKIEALLNNGHSAKEIAAEIHVHISTIYREVKRAAWFTVIRIGRRKKGTIRTKHTGDTVKTFRQKARR